MNNTLIIVIDCSFCPEMPCFAGISEVMAKLLFACQLGKEWVLKKPKTTSSERTIIIPMEIADQIKKQGYVYIGHPGNLTKHLRLVQKKLKIPEFSLHKLRHYFASVLSENGVPEADILALGGWETDYVMKNVYRHSMMNKDEKKKRNAMSQLKGSIF